MSDWNDLTCRGVQNKQFTETFRLNLTHLPSFTFTGQVDIKVKDLRGTTLKT